MELLTALGCFALKHHPRKRIEQLMYDGLPATYKTYEQETKRLEAIGQAKNNWNKRIPGILNKFFGCEDKEQWPEHVKEAKTAGTEALDSIYDVQANADAPDPFFGILRRYVDPARLKRMDLAVNVRIAEAPVKAATDTMNSWKREIKRGEAERWSPEALSVADTRADEASCLVDRHMPNLIAARSALAHFHGSPDDFLPPHRAEHGYTLRAVTGDLAVGRKLTRDERAAAKASAKAALQEQRQQQQIVAGPPSSGSLHRRKRGTDDVVNASDSAYEPRQKKRTRVEEQQLPYQQSPSQQYSDSPYDVSADTSSYGSELATPPDMQTDAPDSMSFDNWLKSQAVELAEPFAFAEAPQAADIDQQPQLVDEPSTTPTGVERTALSEPNDGLDFTHEMFHPDMTSFGIIDNVGFQDYSFEDLLDYNGPQQ